MKIQILSDLHFEHQADGGRGFVKGLDPSGVDVLVVAGDLSSYGLLEQSLRLLCARYPRVVFVSGNHELYGASPAAVYNLRVQLGAGKSKIKNLDWLDDDVVVINGVRFVGSTLWFPDTVLARSQQNWFSDFRAITGLSQWVYDKNRMSRRFLADKMRPNDVLVLHHLPSQRSVLPKFVGSPIGCFFVCDIEEQIATREPQLVVHGHTHDSLDYSFASSRVVCNPHGYVGLDLNASFDSKLVVEVA